MKINEVCKKTGLTKKAIHYYIDCGLIHIAKLENNYYDFKEEDIKKLEQISFLRKMDVSVDSIKKIFEYPTAVNFFLVEERTKLFNEVKEKMNSLLDLTSLIVSLPHNAVPEDIPCPIPSSSDLVNSLLLQIPKDLNYRMLSIYIFTPYTDEFATEYKKYLWQKIELEVQKEFKDTSFIASKYYSFDNNGQKMLQKYTNDFSKTMKIYEATDLTTFVNEFIQELNSFLENEEAIQNWNTYYESIYVPTWNAYNTCAKDVLKEFSKRFSVCNKKIEKILKQTDAQIKDTSIKKDLYAKCHINDETYTSSLFLLFLFNPIDYIN